MPEMRFHVRWPDNTETRCYSPSLIIKEYFVPGTEYPVDDFVERSRTALGIASDRVRAKFGFECSSAKDQLAAIERIAAQHKAVPGAVVRVLSFEE